MSKKDKNSENEKTTINKPEESPETETAAEVPASEGDNAAKKTKKPRKKFRERFTKTTEAAIILLSAAVSFTLFFFAPMDIFLGNQREFLVAFKDAALPMLGIAAASTAALILLMNLLLCIHEWVYRVVSRLLFGTLLASYVQTLFLNSRMTTLTGDDINYSDNANSAMINLIVFVLIMFLPLELSIVAASAPKNKVLNLGKGMLIPYVSGVIFAMQLVGTGTTIISTDFSKYKKTYAQYLSYEPTLSLSKDENIVVFLTDRLDASWMDQTLRKYDEVNDKLDGFTFYKNNISHNTNTFPSVPQMLTNCRYKGQEWADYTREAWEGETLPKILTENGYNVNLLIDSLTTYGSLAQLDGQCSNICERDDGSIEINYLGDGGIVRTMTRLSLAKLSPYVLKTEITRGMGSSPSKDFIRNNGDEKSAKDQAPLVVDVDSDIAYFDYLDKNDLRADSDKKTFSFVHLNFTHGKNDMIKGLYNRFEELSLISTARGAFEIIFKYLDQMKAAGVYDNTTIIIVGDHGRSPAEIEVDGEPGLTSPIVTSLLIKPANSRGRLKTDKESELSNDFFAASVLEYAGIDHSELGYSYNDVINGGLHPDRYMQTFEWNGYGSVLYRAYYKVTGDANDFSNWEVLEGHE